MNKVKDETGSHGIGGLVLYKHRDACTTSIWQKVQCKFLTGYFCYSNKTLAPEI